MVGLDALGIFLLFRSGSWRRCLLALCTFDREITADGIWLILGVLGLVIVEIEIGVRCHDNIVVLACSLDASTFASP